VLKGKAGPGLLDSFSQERAPVARQIVTRANKSIPEFGPIFEALGMDASLDHDTIARRMDARVDPTPEGERRRATLRAAIAYKKYEFDCHGVEMNQRYRSSAVIPDGTPEPAWERDEELHYQPTTWPGARLPHVWVWDRHGTRLSSLDLVGHGRFTVLTGIGGEGWTRAAAQTAAELGIDIVVSAPLLQGQLTRDLPDAVREVFAGSTDAQRALHFAEALPAITTIAVGMRRREHVVENLQAFQSAAP
jgi:2,4-dichlorophenol 6-monooxygenase